MSEPDSTHLETATTRHLRAELAHIEGEVWNVRQLLANGRDCQTLISALLRLKTEVNRAVSHVIRAHAETCVYTRAALAGDEECLKAVRFLIETATQ